MSGFVIGAVISGPVTVMVTTEISVAPFRLILAGAVMRTDTLPIWIFVKLFGLFESHPAMQSAKVSMTTNPNKFFMLASFGVFSTPIRVIEFDLDTKVINCQSAILINIPLYEKMSNIFYNSFIFSYKRATMMLLIIN